MNWESYFFSGIDNSVSEYFRLSADTAGVNFFSATTYLGNWEVVAILFALVVVLFWKYEYANYMISFFITILGGQFTVSILKAVFERPRPEWGARAGELSSFPSGHAALAVLFYGFLTYLVFKINKKRRVRSISLLLGMIIIVIVGFSRIYLGVHYLSDVITGYLCGLLWVAIGFAIHKKYFQDKKFFNS